MIVRGDSDSDDLDAARRPARPQWPGGEHEIGRIAVPQPPFENLIPVPSPYSLAPRNRPRRVRLAPAAMA
jgi:hypothetical protein